MRSRSEHARGGRPEHIDITSMAPPYEQLVGNLAYVRLEEFAQFAGFVSSPQQPIVRARIAQYADELFENYHRVAGLQRTRDEQTPTITPDVLHSTDAFEQRVLGKDWRLALLKSYLVLGMVDDFAKFAGAAAPIQRRALFANVLHHRDREDRAVEILQAEIERDPKLQDELALTGRRLVGDTMLLLRKWLELPSAVEAAIKHDGTADDGVANIIAHLDAAFAEVIVEHTLRMDKLGLTA